MDRTRDQLRAPALELALERAPVNRLSITGLERGADPVAELLVTLLARAVRAAEDLVTGLQAWPMIEHPQCGQRGATA